MWGISAPNPRNVQGSTMYAIFISICTTGQLLQHIKLKNNWTELKQHTTVLTRVQQFWFAYNTSLLSPHTLLLSGHTRNSHFHVLWSFLYHSGKVLKVEAEEINTVLLLFLKFTFFQLPSGIGHHSFTLK